jgi:hypothetical protein
MFVIAGLDPAIHLLRVRIGCPLARTMDTRVKPAYDD